MGQAFGGVSDKAIITHNAFSLHAPSVYHLNGLLFATPVSFLLDTGASVSLIHTDTWERAKPNNHKLDPWKGQSLISVQGTPLQLHGHTEVPIHLTTGTIQTQVVVADKLTTEAILGLDFLEANNCIIDMGKHTLTFPGHPPISLVPAISKENSPRLKVSLVETIRIPASSELEIMAHVSGPPIYKPYLLEQMTHKRLPVCIARALVSPDSSEVPLRVLNPSPEDVILYKDTSVATMQPMENILISPVSAALTSESPDGATSLDVPPSLHATLAALAFPKNGALSQTQSEQLLSVLLSYADIFAADSDDVGRTHCTQHRVDTGMAVPIRQHPRRIPAARREQTSQLLKDMLKKGTIRPSQSPWASPIVLVAKKDGSLRFCIDYRKLNKVTRKDAYPIPRVDDTLDTLAGASWFTTLDLISGYWQVEVSPEDREKTAFCTPDGLYEFNVMPFGLCNAPATFQRLMDSVLAGLQWSTCLVYMDDIVIVGKTFTDHLTNLQQVFQRLRQAGLKLKPSKCSLCQKTVHFLGHVVSQDGITTDPAKTDSIFAWPPPTCKRELQQFLGLTNYYRRFVRDYATIAKPLHRLTEKNSTFHWSSECQTAFETLKQALTSAPLLTHPDYKLPFLLDTDASATGIGAVLSQVHPDGNERVIAYASRTLTKAERQYCVTRRELLSVVFFVQHFRPYLLGRHFSLRTDHSCLTWLHNFKEPEGQLARWITRLQEYNFSIIHRQGKRHGNADAMSRHPCTQCHRYDEELDQTSPSHTTHPTIAAVPLSPQPPAVSRESQLQDSDIGPVFRAMQSGTRPPPDNMQGESPECRQLFQQWDLLCIKHGKLWRLLVNPHSDTHNLQLIVPRPLRKAILLDLHDSDTGGHLGECKTLSRLRQRYYWPGQATDVKNWCRTCPTCASRKTPAPANRAPLHTIRAGFPMQTVAIDIMGPFPESPSGNRYILVAMDYFTRWAEAYAIPNQEAATVANHLVNELFLRFSPPETLHSDQGRQFESALLGSICRLLGIRKTRTTPYHPQSDGLVERYNRTLLSMLATCSREHPSTWDTYLPKLCMAYNTSVQPTTGYTPFFLMFGREARLPVDIMYGSSPTETVTPHHYAAALSESLQQAYSRVRENMALAHNRQKEYYDQRSHGTPFKPGDLVWLHQPQVPPGQSRKLHCPWSGPYEILNKLSDCTYKIRALSNQHRVQIAHFNRLKWCPPQMRRSHRPTSTSAAAGTKSIGQEMELDLSSDNEGPPNLSSQSHSPNPPRRYPTRSTTHPDRLSYSIGF